MQNSSSCLLFSLKCCSVAVQLQELIALAHLADFLFLICSRVKGYPSAGLISLIASRDNRPYTCIFANQIHQSTKH